MAREHPVTIGNRSEARVLAALLDRFDTVLLPYGGNCRYDLVVDTPEGFKRIQCKTGRLMHGAITFKTCSSTEFRPNGQRRPCYGQADFFGVYCPELGSVYLVPVNDCGRRSGSLRVDPAKNSQAAGTRPAANYQIFPLLVRQEGFEPPTLRLRGDSSTRLSYRRSPARPPGGR
jgi:hypothetical protein